MTEVLRSRLVRALATVSVFALVAACGSNEESPDVNSTSGADEWEPNAAEEGSALFGICDDYDWESLGFDDLVNPELKVYFDGEELDLEAVSRLPLDNQQSCRLSGEVYVGEQFLDEDASEDDPPTEYLSRILTISAGHGDFEEFSRAVDTEIAQNNEFRDDYVEHPGEWWHEGELGSWETPEWLIESEAFVSITSPSVDHDNDTQLHLYRSDGEFHLAMMVSYWYDGDFESGIEYAQEWMLDITDQIYADVSAET